MSGAATASEKALVLQRYFRTRLKEAEERTRKAEAERDAYRKAKQENDERFQLEATRQRVRAENAEAIIARVEVLAMEPGVVLVVDLRDALDGTR